MPVSIAGMHRSGTSMVARLLNQCGLYLGHEADLLPPTPHNPEGFWENIKFVDLNDDILNELGGGWDYPPAIPNGWHEGDSGLRLRAKAQTILEEFSGHEPWGWKDPRNSLTLPFWMNIFPDMKVVICLRNPLEVAVSLYRRGRCSYSLSLDLWRIYNQHILDFTSPECRIITHYDAYLCDPRAELRRLLVFVSMAASEEDIERCCSTVKTGLYHNRFTTQHMLDADVSPSVLDLYARMCDEAGWSERALGRHVPGVNVSRSDIGRWLRRADGKRMQHAHAEQREPTAVARERTLRPVVKSVVDMELLRREAEALRPQLAAREAAIRDLQRQLEERAMSGDEVAQRDTTIRSLQATLQEKEAVERQVTRLREAAESQTQRLDALAAQVESVSSQQDDLRAMLRDVRDQLLRRDDEIEGTIQVLKAAMAATPPQNDPNARTTGQRAAEPIPTNTPTGYEKYIAYQQLIGRMRRVVCDVVPRDATVLVVSKGDDELLKLDGRRAWHFPQTESGLYAGHHPADGTAAVTHLERLRAKGAQFLVLPSTAFWWLDHYREFRQHIESHYRVLVRQEETCLIFALGGPNTERRHVERAEQLEYQRLVHQIREVVRSILPHDATVLVVSKGDDELLKLDGRRAWHFPQTESGAYAGHHPADSTAAITHLERLRTKGAQFLVFPSTGFWWLQHYTKFNQYLARHYRLAARQKHICLIFALQENRLRQTQRRHPFQQPSGSREDRA